MIPCKVQRQKKKIRNWTKLRLLIGKRIRYTIGFLQKYDAFQQVQLVFLIVQVDVEETNSC